MIWAGIVNQTLIGPFKVDEEVKLNSTNYCNFMNKIFFAQYKSQSCNFKVNYVLMLDNAPSHSFKLTCEFFEHKRFSEEKIMEQPPSSPYQKSIVKYKDKII